MFCPGCSAAALCGLLAGQEHQNFNFFFPLRIWIQNDSAMIHTRRILPAACCTFSGWSQVWMALLALLSLAGAPKPPWPFLRHFGCPELFAGQSWGSMAQKRFNFSFLVLAKVKSPPTVQPICASAEIISLLKALQALCPAAPWLCFFNLIAFVPPFTMNIHRRFIEQARKSKERRRSTNEVLKNQNFNWNNWCSHFVWGGKKRGKKKKRGFWKIFFLLHCSCKGMSLISLEVSMSSWVHEKVTERMTPKPLSVAICQGLPTKLWLCQLYLS